MASFIVCVFILITLINQSTTAVEKQAHTLLKHNMITIDSEADSNVSHKHLQSLCSNYYNTFHCWTGEPTLKAGYCATYNNDTKLVSLLNCPYFQPNGYNSTTAGTVLLPRNLSQLNDYMCGPLNRKGLVCSECADGFGPSGTPFGYRCVNCTDTWYGVPLFLFLEFVPITAFYVIILAFQISVTSAPMPCFIFCSQLIVIAFYSNNIHVLHEQNKLLITDQWDIRLDMKIVFTLYQALNLDLGQNFLPPYCVSNKLKFIHIAFMGYISAFYPIMLIFLTWVCVELHGRNFRPLVWLWRPVHRCFVRLRRGWDTKSDIIDAFTTFFFLTYSKILCQTLLLISSKPIRNIEPSGKSFLTYVSVVDHSVDYGSLYYLSFVIPGVLISLIFNILPPLLLILYPIRIFRSCLSKCHLNSIVMHTFLDKVYACYRNGLDGGRDMRSFSSLYFFLEIMGYFIALLTHTMNSSSLCVSRWFALGTILFLTTLAMTIAKPYRKAYMNHLNTLLLSNYTILCYVLSSGFRTQLVARILITTPIAVFIVSVILKKVYNVSKSYVCKLKSQLCIPDSFNCFRSKRMPIAVESPQSSTANTPTSTQPLIRLTSTVMSYGIKDN